MEDRQDPLQRGRLRVRAYRWHTWDKGILPTEQLIWAWPIQELFHSTLYPTQQQGTAVNGGIGTSPTGLIINTTVFGFFADGRECQIPILMGGVPSQTDGYPDVSPLATGQDTVIIDYIGPEPHSSYKTKYPYNKVTTTEQGHVIEVDDTPGHERLRIVHDAKTYVEVNQVGRRIDKVVDDWYEIVVKDKIIYIQGNLKIHVIGNIQILAEGAIDITSNTAINLNAPIITENSGVGIVQEGFEGSNQGGTQVGGGDTGGGQGGISSSDGQGDVI